MEPAGSHAVNSRALCHAHSLDFSRSMCSTESLSGLWAGHSPQQTQRSMQVSASMHTCQMPGRRFAAGINRQGFYGAQLPAASATHIRACGSRQRRPLSVRAEKASAVPGRKCSLLVLLRLQLVCWLLPAPASIDEQAMRLASRPPVPAGRQLCTPEPCRQLQLQSSDSPPSQQSRSLTLAHLHRWWALIWAPPTRLWLLWRAASPPSSQTQRAIAPRPA